MLPRWSILISRAPPPTPGINVKQKKVRGAGSFVIWDMAGHIEYHVTHAMMLGSCNGVFIVAFDMMNNAEEIEKQVSVYHGYCGLVLLFEKATGKYHSCFPHFTTPNTE